jgi:hypothetical protein
MNSKNACLEVTLEELRLAGHTPIVAHGSKHVQVRWDSRRGYPRMVTIGATPSDWRSPQNARRDVRNILRKDGELPVEQPAPRAPKQLSRLEVLEQRLAMVEQRLRILGEA